MKKILQTFLVLCLISFAACKMTKRKSTFRPKTLKTKSVEKPTFLSFFRKISLLQIGSTNGTRPNLFGLRHLFRENFNGNLPMNLFFRLPKHFRLAPILEAKLLKKSLKYLPVCL